LAREYEYYLNEMDRYTDFYIVQKEKIIMHIKVSPGKALNKITGIANNELCLYIKAPPEKGRANKEIIRFFAKTLDIPKSDVVIKSGQMNRHKTIILPVCTLEKIKNIRRLL